MKIILRYQTWAKEKGVRLTLNDRLTAVKQLNDGYQAVV